MIDTWIKETTIDEEDPDMDISQLAGSFDDSSHDVQPTSLIDNVSGLTILEKPKGKNTCEQTNELVSPSVEPNSLADVGKLHSDESTTLSQTVAETAKEVKQIRDRDSDEIADWKDLISKNPDNLALQNRLADSTRMPQDAIDKGVKVFIFAVQVGDL
jgi:hypothetical protein